MPALPAYPWPLKPFAGQHPVRGFLCDPRIAGGGRTFHFGIDIAAPAGTAVYAVAPGKVSYGSPGDVNANGGIVVVEASNRNFGYWHVKPTVQPGSHVPLHALLGHVAAQPEDWGHVHFAESTHDRNGITYWNPLRPGAISPFHDYGPPVIDAIIASLPPKLLQGLVDFSVKSTRQHTNRGHPAKAARLARPARHPRPHPLAPHTERQDQSCHGGSSSTTAAHSDLTIRGTPPGDTNFAAIYAARHHTKQPQHPGQLPLLAHAPFNTNDYPDGDYRLEVEASDVRGNPRTATLDVTFDNAG